MEKISYSIMSFDSPDREEIPISARTDRGARIAAKKTARELGIKKYSIVFFRDSDGCHGTIDK